MAHSFATLDLPKEFLNNLESLGYMSMTEIQAASLPIVLDKKDVIAQAKTGSGKTAAFGIGLLANLPKEADKMAHGLVLCPTRELADQIAKEIRRLARHIPNIKVLTLTGGMPIGPQLRSLEHGAQIIVGTPGRVEDHLRKRSLNLNYLKQLVLDEADRMLDMGFMESINNIISHTPESRQTLFFSATFPDSIQELSEQFQNDPIKIKVESVHKGNKIKQAFIKCASEQKTEALSQTILEKKIQRGIIFCQTKIDCDTLTAELIAKGFAAGCLHGDLIQKERDEVLTLFANGSLSFLIATDVAARGIDIKQLESVISFELPRDPQVHIHRVGRTGRADHSGLAINFFSERETGRFKRICEYTGDKFPVSNWSKSRQLNRPQQPQMQTIKVAIGKKQKLRPGDILGALTKGSEVPNEKIGAINIFPFCSYIAIDRSTAKARFSRIKSTPMKGRVQKMRLLK